MKTALILVAALVQQPAQNDTGVASLEPGQSIKCGAAEANKSCKKAGWV